MPNEYLKQIGSFLKVRRPVWKFILEDEILRIITQQYVVSWKIVEQIKKIYKLDIVDVTSHATFGIVICVKMPAGE